MKAMKATDPGIRLMQIRASLNLTQGQAAELWGIPAATLAAYEDGAYHRNGFLTANLNQLLHQVEAMAASAPPQSQDN